MSGSGDCQSDNETGACTAVSHLIARGHRQIAYLRPAPEADPNFDQRRNGYLKSLREHRLGAITAPMVHDDAATAARALLRPHPDVTALFGCNDAFAIDALRVAQELGRRVPEDLSVIGFDDIELATQVTPAPTTMTVDKVTMGRPALQSPARISTGVAGSRLHPHRTATAIARERISFTGSDRRY